MCTSQMYTYKKDGEEVYDYTLDTVSFGVWKLTCADPWALVRPGENDDGGGAACDPPRCVPGMP